MPRLLHFKYPLQKVHEHEAWGFCCSGPLLEAEFVDSDQLGLSLWKEPRQYDAVTCMFAIHYFFVTERALDNFLHNVAINLKDGETLRRSCPGTSLISPGLHKASEATRKAKDAHRVAIPICTRQAMKSAC
jgi:hypothetical protein